MNEKMKDLIFTNGSMKLKMYNSKKNYAIMHRLNDDSFIVVWDLVLNLEKEACHWSQGYYDLTLEKAKKLLNKKTK